MRADFLILLQIVGALAIAALLLIGVAFLAESFSNWVRRFKVNSDWVTVSRERDKALAKIVELEAEVEALKIDKGPYRSNRGYK